MLLKAIITDVVIIIIDYAVIHYVISCSIY